jgi:hypothetical protein
MRKAYSDEHASSNIDQIAIPRWLCAAFVSLCQLLYVYYNKLYMIVMLINLSYLSLSCYNAIKNRNILFPCF